MTIVVDVSAYGHRDHLRGVDMQPSPPLPTYSGVNPRLGRPYYMMAVLTCAALCDVFALILAAEQR
jgi:hypothetical protein